MRPKIRFKGFKDNWQEKKILDAADRFDNLRIPIAANLRIPGKTPYYGANGIQDYVDGFTHEGEFILVAEDGANDVKDYPIIKVKGHIWVNNHAHVIQGKKDICYNSFLSYCMKKIDYSHLLLGGSRAKLNAEVLMNIKLITPELAEQSVIGNFFENIDEIILLQSKKIEKLRGIKKVLMNRLFPLEQENIPKIRFKGFKNEWKLKKIGDCFKERNERMPNGELISVTINEGIKKFIELGRHDNSNEDKSKYKKVCIGDIAYNSMRMWQGASGCSPYEGIVSPAYTVLSPNSEIFSQCLAYQFKLPSMLKIFQKNSQGITSDNWNLKYPVLSKIELYISPSYEEQVKISNLLGNLDRLINLQIQKLNKLKYIKRTLINKMFV